MAKAKPTDLKLYSNPLDKSKQREYSRSLVREVTNFISADPGHSVKYYANQRALQISETIINGILLYSREGNTLVRKGFVAVPRVGAWADWAYIKDAKTPDAPKGENQQIVSNAATGTTALALVAHPTIGSTVSRILAAQQANIFRLKCVPRRRFQKLDALDADLTALANFGLTAEQEAADAKRETASIEERLARLEGQIGLSPIAALPAPSKAVAVTGAKTKPVARRRTVRSTGKTRTSAARVSA